MSHFTTYGAQLRFFAVVCLMAFAGMLLYSTPSFATFIVMSGNNPEPDEENVLLDNNQVGMTLQGSTQNSDTVIEISSATQFLASQAAGQASVEARESNDINSDQVAIDDTLTISSPNPAKSFRDVIFNASIVGNLGTGGAFTITVNGFESNGDPVSTTLTQDTDSDPLELDNGSNFYTVLAIDGQRITSVEISPNAGTSYAELRQIRLSGVVPEPATAMLIALGAITFLACRRR